jgi:hypothetical protein
VFELKFSHEVFEGKFERSSKFNHGKKFSKDITKFSIKYYCRFGIRMLVFYAEI